MTDFDADAEARLLALAREGDEEALTTLLERYQAKVYRFGMKMCRDPEDAEDVLQETLLAMARSIRDFRGDSSISTWLFTVARRFCIKKRRKSSHAPEETSLDGREESAAVRTIADPSRGPDEALAGKQIEAAIEQAIRSLEPMYREVLVLRDIEGLTAKEVASVLGISDQAVKSRLHRARVAVRDHIAPILGVRKSERAKEGSCPDVLTLYSQYLEDEISADLCSAMERHLEGCARCRDACDSLKRSLALCRTTGRETEVPSSVQREVKRALEAFMQAGG